MNAVLEEPDGSLWVGTVEEGLNLRRAGKQDFEHYTTAAPARLSHNSVSALASDGKGRIYVGTWGGGLGWMNGSNSPDKAFHPIVRKETRTVPSVCQCAALRPAERFAVDRYE